MNDKTCNSDIKNQPTVCRLCLALTTTHFSLTEDTKTSRMLEALTSLRIMPSDDISTVMCLKCCLNLRLAFSIQQNMLKAERKFREQRLSFAIKQENDIENVEAEENKVEEVDETHSNKEDGSEEFLCHICDKKWSSKVFLGKHIRTVHVQVDCGVCGKTFKQGTLKAHMANKHPTTGELYTCDICGKQKSSKVALYKHKHCVHKVRNAPRKISPRKIKAKKVKPLTKTEEETLICDICGAKKSSKSALCRHKLSVHRQTKCTICDKVVKKDSLKKHLKTHDEIEQGEYFCDICGKVKHSLASLKTHKYAVHVESECPICKKTVSKANLKTHINRHTDSRIVCDLCGISVLPSDLRLHKDNVHKGRQLKCHFCEKIFKQYHSRSAHEKREHLDEANFNCETCGKKFYQKVSLKRHIEGTHLKKRPYICDFCNVGFSSKFALKTHRRQHTNERPFKCELCGEGFRQKVSLKSHLKSQHNIAEELNYECKVCGKMFASSVALVAHKRIH